MKKSRSPLETPYSRPVWKQIRNCARKVEAAVKDSGTLLTMGGEPTFVPLNPEGAEWNVDALGPTKLSYARKFALEFIREFFPGALLTQTYGKLYPGEPLPRWSLLVHIHPNRRLWNEPERLLAGPPSADNTIETAKHFAQKLAQRIGLQTYLYEAANPETPAVTQGCVLPLDYTHDNWISGKWPYQDDKYIVLIPGDSSMGLRLPLTLLPESCLKQALTVEIKDGGLDVFIPPLSLEPYLNLIGHIETLAAELDVHDLVISGYPPGNDDLLERYAFTSDPGVIEVNLPPAGNWSEHARQLKMLYHAAHKSGLCAHKLHFNGRAVATGGGAHICFGGPKPELSPIFHLPHLLPNILRYWQHHPSLSYIFSGQSVGPGSQAPRIDESTYDALTELEIAFDGAPSLAHDPKLFGMLFRDLITDRSGNTHRAEISIDKLWNPLQPNGTCGILEFRAFESQPDCERAAAIGLFIRAIIAMLARNPFKKNLLRWGQALHDRFFLPSILWLDLAGVAADLKKAGIPFDVSWLRPHFDFRFPTAGLMSAGKETLTVRYAIEAWPLLGEQPAGSLTVRSVDSSTERIELSLSSPKALDKGLLQINGIPVPFKVEKKLAVAALRYRAFHTLPSLHPHIPAQTPLLLEWVSLKSGQVQSAVKWHSWQPNHQPYPSRPADCEEAQKRCRERWVPQPDLVGSKRKIPRKWDGHSKTFTTDLRRLHKEISNLKSNK